MDREKGNKSQRERERRKMTNEQTRIGRKNKREEIIREKNTRERWKRGKKDKEKKEKK